MSASQRTNRPSASVLSISTVCPDIVFTTSPGLVALLPGIFSAEATTPMILDFGFIKAIASMVPKTLAAPLMSYFISSIAGLGFKLIPPVSKVMPFPTITSGCSVFLPPLYSIIMNLDSCTLPFPTDKRQCIPSFSISFSPRTFTDRFLYFFPSSLAVFPR